MFVGKTLKNAFSFADGTVQGRVEEGFPGNHKPST